MSQANVVDLTENKVSFVIDEILRLPDKISVSEFKKRFNSTIPQVHMNSFFHSINAYHPIYLSDVYVDMFGYSGSLKDQKIALKRLLKSKFSDKQGIDWFEFDNKEYESYYKIHQKSGKVSALPEPTSNHGEGKIKHIIFTPDRFKILLMSSNTTKSNQIKEYYIQVEKLSVEYDKYSQRFDLIKAEEAKKELAELLKRTETNFEAERAKAEAERAKAEAARKKAEANAESLKAHNAKMEIIMNKLDIKNDGLMSELSNINTELTNVRTQNTELITRVSDVQLELGHVRDELDLANENLENILFDRAYVENIDYAKRESFVVLRTIIPTYIHHVGYSFPPAFYILRRQIGTMDAAINRIKKITNTHIVILIRYDYCPNARSMWSAFRNHYGDRGISFKNGSAMWFRLVETETESNFLYELSLYTNKTKEI